MSKHLKRLAQPRRWKLPRKTALWAPKARPGPHGARDSLPLVVALRDELGLADRNREAKRIVNEGQVLVDGRVCRDPRRGVGLMDVVSIPALEQQWRVLYDTHGRLTLTKIAAKDVGFKLSRVEGKTTVKKGRFQVNLHDGRNIVLKEAPYKSGDVLKLKLPSQEVAEHFPFKEGAPVFVTGGTHIGTIANLVSHEVSRSSGPNLVRLEAAEEFDTVRSYAFVVGKDQPVISPPEVAMNV